MDLDANVLGCNPNLAMGQIVFWTSDKQSLVEDVESVSEVFSFSQRHLLQTKQRRLFCVLPLILSDTLRV